MKGKLTVSSFQPQYKQHFVDLNIEWLEHYFYVEEHDREVLNQCEEYILAPGGEIFFFLLNGDVVGTYAYMKMEENVFEFTKMAVNPAYRGQGIGNEMMLHALDYAKLQEFKTIIIYSSSVLQNALHLYRKYGFIDIPIEKDGPYARGDVKMKLEL